MKKLLLLLFICSQPLVCVEDKGPRVTIMPYKFMQGSLPKIWYQATFKKGSPLPHNVPLYSLIGEFQNKTYKNEEIEDYYKKVEDHIGKEQKQIRDEILKNTYIPRKNLQKATHISLENLRFVLHDKILNAMNDGKSNQIKNKKTQWSFELTEKDLKRIFPVKETKYNSSL